jgi:hypothetical protein
LDSLQLGPDGDQELYDTRAVLVRLRVGASPPAADLVPLLAGAAGRDRLLGIVELPVLDLLERLLLVERRLVLDDGLGEALVLRRSAGGELGRDGRRGLYDGRVVDRDRLGRRWLDAGDPGAARPRLRLRLATAVALLGQALRAALGLPLLGPLPVTCHRCA